MTDFLIILILVFAFVLGGALVLLKTAKKPHIKNPEKINRKWEKDDDEWK
jgi:uncharacterized protein YneF (UPF0154 family)